MLKNRIFASLTAVIMIAVLLSSCAAPTPAPTAAPAPANTQAPGTAPQATSAPVAAASDAFLTVNLEQQATWVRNFNPSSPDARLQATQGCIYEPMMIFNKSTGELVPW